jgi:hypothetical protein
MNDDHVQASGRSAAGLVPETVVVVFDQVWPLEQRVVVAGTGLGRSQQQVGDAPQATATDFRPGAAGSG